VPYFGSDVKSCGETLEEIGELFSKDGPRPWKVRSGESRLDVEIRNVIDTMEK
jgi:hypothetical protein